ncbi:hypothetical protein BGV77_24435 [Klebsiella pneumoniae]|nr:hypothetical protein APU03_12540 [Klebsiella pneumoniae]OCV42230.1 hypothetical protein A8V41_10140 [Klebsiella pneumoniae]OCV61373.1 hypothetical protein A9P87_06735 [Klebsiella pneumoniae]OFC64668.1 hypothetical protein BB937_26910 [Klebsiella pneumoniae]OFI08913.1 hypothetical protein BEE59_24170 [Klebsiella pneumoniae]
MTQASSMFESVEIRLMTKNIFMATEHTMTCCVFQKRFIVEQYFSFNRRLDFCTFGKASVWILSKTIKAATSAQTREVYKR